MTAAAPGGRPIRVLLVGPSLAYLGGQAIQAGRLLRRLSDDPALEPAFLPVNPQLPGIGAALQRVKYVRTVVTSIAYVFSLLRRVRHVDVVHAFSASYWSFLLAPVPAMLVARLFGRRVLLNYRSGEADDHLANWPGAVRLVHLAHEVVVPSGYLVDVFGKYGVRARSIFNFVEVDNLTYRERGPVAPRFLSNRNFEAHYNVACVLRAFALIQQRYPDASLVVAGDGPQRDELHALAASLGLNNVSFPGAVRPDDMPALYDAADIYLNSPSVDNMPNSIIEAFGSGLPVVTTNAGGIPYIVRHEENGLMVPTDDHEGLAREACRLLEDAGLARQLSRDSRAECLDRYSWQAVGAEWRSCYQRLAALPSPGTNGATGAGDMAAQSPQR